MNRRLTAFSLAVLSTALLCGASSPSGCTSAPQGQIGPSNGEVYGIAAAVVGGVVVGTVVLVEVHKSHHTLRGCVAAGPSGLTVIDPKDNRTWAVTGTTAGVKVGDKVQLRGTKEKHQKDSAGDEEFVVQKMSRDLGPCKTP